LTKEYAILYNSKSDKMSSMGKNCNIMNLGDTMKIMEVLTYYRPHTSGLTIYVERLSRALVERGHDVTVLTSRFDRKLPPEELCDGVSILRVPVLMRISKGVVMPSIGFVATRLVREADIIHLHLPQFDAAGIALRGRLFNKPTIITYHCDLQLGTGIMNSMINRIVYFMNNIAGACTHRIVTYTKDFADNSRYLQRFSRKVSVISPPVELPKVQADAVTKFNDKFNPRERWPVIGMATRFAAEKGVEVLLAALGEIEKYYPDFLVLYSGQYENVLSESQYYQRLRPQIKYYMDRGNWIFTGVLTQREMPLFYKNITLLCVPSLNSTESFGLVQIEAMMHGVPVIASDLPGVRQPVKMTGMGLVSEIGNSSELSKAIITILGDAASFIKAGKEIKEQFSPQSCAAEYEAIFSRVREEINPGKVS